MASPRKSGGQLLIKCMGHRAHKGYEEVKVPAQASGSKADEKLVMIDELDDWAQVAFQGYKYASTPASTVFHSSKMLSNAEVILWTLCKDQAVL